MKRMLLSIIALIVVACGKNDSDKGLDAIFDEGATYIDYFFVEPYISANNQEVTCMHYGNLDKRNLVSIYGAAPYELIEEAERVNSNKNNKIYPVALFQFTYNNGEFTNLERIGEWILGGGLADTIRIDGMKRIVVYNTCIETQPTNRHKAQGWFYYEHDRNVFNDQSVVCFDGGTISPWCGYDAIVPTYVPSSSLIEECRELNETSAQTYVIAAQFRYIVTDRGQKTFITPLNDWEIKEVRIDTIINTNISRVYVQ